MRLSFVTNYEAACLRVTEAIFFVKEDDGWKYDGSDPNSTEYENADEGDYYPR